MSLTQKLKLALRKNLSVLYAKKDLSEKTMVRVLCLGDSLTDGYAKFGSERHPYGTTLQKLFDNANKNVTVTINGVSGQRILYSGMKNSLQKSLDDVQSRGEKFDCVIILGGINDIPNFESNPDNLFLALTEMYEMCFKAGAAYVIGCTLLEVGVEITNSRFEKKREDLNILIKSYSPLSVSDTSEETIKPIFRALDTSTLFPLRSLSVEKRVELWDHDGVHLTKAGYAQLGKVIFEGIKDLFEIF